MSTPPTISALDAASDPVCGGLTNVYSEFRASYYGKDLYFCSEKCLELYLADPDAYEAEGTVYMAGGQTFGTVGVRRITPVRKASPAAAAPTGTAAAVTPVHAAPAAGSSPSVPVTGNLAHPPAATAVLGAGVAVAAPSGASGEGQAPEGSPDEPTVDLTIARLPSRRAAAKAVREEERASGNTAADLSPLEARMQARANLQGGGLLGWLRRLRVQRRERRAITRAAQEMVAAFRRITLGRSALDRHACYREMVMARLGNDAAGAERLLAQAGTSFASWPRRRALTLRDVVHFVAVLEYLADHPSCTALSVDVGKLVTALVPADL